ncbi:Allene oxide synthase-lipoxygenase protein [Nymphon striatum]|nr:Allene oxide synthase-lipoxygenase protein [Nymphon striatum]
MKEQNKIITTSSYTRVTDFIMTIHSSEYPVMVTSEIIYFSLQGTKGTWTPEVFLDTSIVCVPGKVTKITIMRPQNFGDVKQLQFRFENESFLNQWWFIDSVTVGPPDVIGAELDKVRTSYFPLRRWISAQRLNIFSVKNTFLPQDDENFEQRQMELDEMKIFYTENVEAPGQPPMLDEISIEDDYDYYPQRSELIKLKTRLKRLALKTHVLTTKFKTLDDLKKLYVTGFAVPEVSSYWKSDLWFGKMRLQGANPVLIKVCHNIPENFAVKESEIAPFLNRKSLSDCLKQRKIFITDLAALKDSECDGYKMWAPMALFYLNKARELLPIAIQLYQEPGNNNPVFLPTDDPNTWTLAKIYYNCAEAVHHESFTHLGGIHIMLGSVWVATRRELSVSHPIFKLMAPHFYRLLGNNFYGIAALFRPDGIMDEIFQGKTKMAKSLFNATISYKTLNLEMDFAQREVLESNNLPEYPYRDDIMLFYEALKKYVTTVVSRYYDSQEQLIKDYEIQKWRKCMGKKVINGGCGLTDLPGSNEDGFKCNSELIDTVATIISVSTIKHAAVNYCQYELFGFPANSPLSMRKAPPTTKAPITEAEILKCLPNKKTMLMSMVFLSVLSYLDGNPLGEFEKQYLYHPEDVKANKM